MCGIYDDGASYGTDPDAEFAQDLPADPIYDDGDWYGPPRSVRTATVTPGQQAALVSP
ncbi:hypothetical protein ABZV92_19985 [Streptomyces rubiginosohelvolus]|uniref:hypothetical protein n=1 Tax=Streptomyces rubiginosohelvolus TaxID=67362 RepID=UPI0033B8E48E